MTRREARGALESVIRETAPQNAGMMADAIRIRSVVLIHIGSKL